MKEYTSWESETRNGYTIPTTMKKVWNIQLNMLHELLEVCKDNHLRIWCAGGTLLGAVRHHGYIPWDDDMDLLMPRPDYDKLVELGPKCFKEPYFLQNAKSDEHYARAHSQLRYSQSAAIRPSDCYRPFNQGIFIDIFCFEGYIEDSKEREEILNKSFRIMKGLKSIDYPILWSGRFGLLFRKYYWRHKVKKEGFYNLFRPVEEMFRKHSWDESEHIAAYGIDRDKYRFDKSWYDETLWVPFENMEVPIPKEYDKVLRTQYGDNYMTPKMVAANHGGLIIDTERSYKDIMPEVRKQYRRSALKRLFKKL